MPCAGEEVFYRAFAGQIYTATVRCVRPDGLLDIDVDLGLKDTFGRTRVKWCEAKTEERGVCFPKETT